MPLALHLEFPHQRAQQQGTDNQPHTTKNVLQKDATGFFSKVILFG